MSHPKYKHIGSAVTRTIEECSELIQVLCKVERFGWDNIHPETKISNITRVRAEIEDVLNCIFELQTEVMGNK